MPELQLQRTGDTLAVTFGEHRAAVPCSASVPNEQTGQHIYEAADEYGRTLFEQVMRDEGLHSALSALPTNERLMLVTDDLEVASLPWEYLRDPNNMLLASRLNVVRYVLPARPRAPLDLTQALTIVAVPVSPADEPRMLNTEREWQHLVEAVQVSRKVLTRSGTGVASFRFVILRSSSVPNVPYFCPCPQSTAIGSLWTRETSLPRSSAEGLCSLSSLRLRIQRLIALDQEKILNQQTTAIATFETLSHSDQRMNLSSSWT